jgi:hypothetical protein
MNAPQWQEDHGVQPTHTQYQPFQPVVYREPNQPQQVYRQPLQPQQPVYYQPSGYTQQQTTVKVPINQENQEFRWFQVQNMFLFSIFMYVVSYLSLGLLAPYMQSQYYKKVFKNARLGGHQVKFVGSAWDIFGVVLVNFFLNIFSLGLWYFLGLNRWFLGKKLDTLIMLRHENQQSGEWKFYSAGNVGMDIKFWLIVTLSAGFLYPLAVHYYYEDYFAQVLISGKRVKYTGKMGDMFGMFWLTGLLIMMFAPLACCIQVLFMQSFYKYLDKHLAWIDGDRSMPNMINHV